MEPLTLLFVYGTLKQNFFNHTRYLGVAELHGNASYLYQARTVVKYPLVIRPRHLPPCHMWSSVNGSTRHRGAY